MPKIFGRALSIFDFESPCSDNTISFYYFFNRWWDVQLLILCWLSLFNCAIFKRFVKQIVTLLIISIFIIIFLTINWMLTFCDTTKVFSHFLCYQFLEDIYFLLLQILKELSSKLLLVSPNDAATSVGLSFSIINIFCFPYSLPR